jgi:hypothetical protein
MVTKVGNNRQIHFIICCIFFLQCVILSDTYRNIFGMVGEYRKMLYLCNGKKMKK